MSISTITERRWPQASALLVAARSAAGAVDTSDLLFQRRLHNLFSIGYCVLTVLIVAHFFAGTRLSFSVWAALCVAMSFVITTAVQDKGIAFILTFPTWLFVFTGYAYASMQFFVIDSHLISPVETMILVFSCQLAAVVAVVVLQFFGAGLQKPRILRRSDVEDDFPEIRTFAMIALTVPIVLAAALYDYDHGAANAPLQAAGTLALSFLIVTIAVQLYDVRSSRQSIIVVTIVLSLIFTVSVVRNERTNLLLLSIFLGCAALIKIQRLFTIRNIILVVFVSKILSNFSLITLYVRQIAQRDDVGDITSKFISIFFSFENIISIVTLTRLGIAQQFEYIKYSPVFDIPFFSGERSVFARLVELPQLDIIVRFSDFWKSVNYNELWLRIGTALPNFGQQKDNMFGDRIFAYAGIRDLQPDNPLQPMVTAIGEFYYIGGAFVVFVSFIAIFSLFILSSLLLRKYINRNSVFSNIIIVLCFNMVFTSSATSTVNVVIRTIPACIIMLFLLRTASRIVRRVRL